MNPARHHRALSHPHGHNYYAPPQLPDPYGRYDGLSRPYTAISSEHTREDLQLVPRKRSNLFDVPLTELGGGRGGKSRTSSNPKPETPVGTRTGSTVFRQREGSGIEDEVGGDGDGSGRSNPLVINKSRRVRTGCLTCRDRHLKCDEAMPSCNNCRKSGRECKRGLRLNFIDIQVKDPPLAPQALGWSVQIQDESRVIASEYQGGLERYSRLDDKSTDPIREKELNTELRRHSVDSGNRWLPAHDKAYELGVIDRNTPMSRFDSDENRSVRGHRFQSQKDSDSATASEHASTSQPVSITRLGSNQGMLSHTTAREQHTVRETQDHTSHIHGQRAIDIPNMPSSHVQQHHTAKDLPGFRPDNQEFEQAHSAVDKSTAPSPDKMSGERDYLNSAEEIRFMQVFIDEVALWMDTMDKDKHFTNMAPYLALKSPMMLNAFLACGVKQLTLVESHDEDKALFYYETATTQLLRTLQNPDRDIAECATTAVVLNVYEIMSESPAQRMSHIAGARALIRECGWDASSTGIGAACFWLNIGMEVLSCLAHNWQTAWDPDQWALDIDFRNWTATTSEPGGQTASSGEEELWVHRILYIVAKTVNFRASIPRFQEHSPQDEQIRLQSRYVEWQTLKDMCDVWNSKCPSTMRPYGYTHTPSGKSLFPNIWLIKQPAVIARLFYHTAMCLLAQVNPNPLYPGHSEQNKRLQLHHAHQTCGIVAHTRDRGVASVAIRSLATAGAVLEDRAEQAEVIVILERISKETGWRLQNVVADLKKTWGWHTETDDISPTNTTSSSRTPSFFSLLHSHAQSQTAHPHPHHTPRPHHHQGMPGPSAPSSSSVATTRPNVNPLLVNADFSNRNHPYQNWYQAPNKNKTQQQQARQQQQQHLQHPHPQQQPQQQPQQPQQHLGTHMHSYWSK